MTTYYPTLIPINNLKRKDWKEQKVYMFNNILADVNTNATKPRVQNDNALIKEDSLFHPLQGSNYYERNGRKVLLKSIASKFSLKLTEQATVGPANIFPPVLARCICVCDHLSNGAVGSGNFQVLSAESPLGFFYSSLRTSKITIIHDETFILKDRYESYDHDLPGDLVFGKFYRECNLPVMFNEPDTQDITSCPDVTFHWYLWSTNYSAGRNLRFDAITKFTFEDEY